MKKIALHITDKANVIESNFEFCSENVDYYNEVYKDSFKYVLNLYKYSIESLNRSNYINKSTLDEKRLFFKYASNCISEVARVSKFENQEVEINIGEEKPHKTTVKNLEIVRGIISMMDGLNITIISRNKGFIKNVADAPLSLYGIDKTHSDNFFISLIKLLRKFYSENSFDQHYYQNIIEDFNNREADIGPNPRQQYRIYYLIDYVKAFKALVDNDQLTFEKYLFSSLTKFKEVWSQKKSLNKKGIPFLRDEQGFISWENTALMVAAFDKGWKLDLETDYTPKEMINMVL